MRLWSYVVSASPAYNFCIYALIDPRDGRAFYVGATTRGLKRIHEHAKRQGLKTDEKWNWQKAQKIKSLPPRHPDLPFDFRILKTFDNKDDPWKAEDDWIKAYRLLGEPLLNRLPGGRKPNLGIIWSAETLAKMSAAKRGRQLSPEHRANMASAHKGKKHSAETRVRMSISALKRSPEYRLKISAALKGRTLSPETRTKISVALKGRTLSAEHIANSAAGNRGKKLSPEHKALLRSSENIAKISAALRGRKKSPEHVAKVASSIRETWRRKRAEESTRKQ